MQVQYTTANGAKIELSLNGKVISVSVNGQHRGQLHTAQEHPTNGYVLRVDGLQGMIGVPCINKSAVKAMIDEKGRRIVAEYAVTDEARFATAMMIHERNDDDGADHAERVWR